MDKVFLLFIILSLSIFSNAQTTSGDVQQYLNDYIANVPGDSGNDYSEPSDAELDTWETVVAYILEDNISEARTTASNLNYQITEFTDTSLSPNQVFYILEEQSTQQKYWGTYVFNPTPLRGNLILQAPHIKNDINTGSQAVFSMKNNLARAVFLNGTHRCNNSTLSNCSGTTSTCGSGNEAYKISDLAHNTSSAFQRTTEVLFNTIPNSIFIQLHGFGKGENDPSLIISNGTRDTPFKDYATELKDALIIEDNILDAKIAHIDTDWSRLIGFTNTQGRFSNYSIDACSEPAEGTSGRFIHVEQELIKLRLNSLGWQKMSNALGTVFKVDRDGDGVESSSDPDDNDACNPSPNNGNCNSCDQLISFSDFDIENDLGVWNDGGNNAFQSTINSIGEGSMRLKHGDENGNAVDVNSSMFTNPLDLSAYDNIKVEMSFINPVEDSFDLNDKFLLEVSNDGGSTYTIVKTWEYNVDFVEGLRYFESIILEGPFTQNTVVRIRAFANSDADRIWVDNVALKGCENISLSTIDFNKEIGITLFPNPSKGEVSLQSNSKIESLEVFNVAGKKVFSRNYNNATFKKKFNLSQLEEGIYFVRVYSKNKYITKKLILN